MLLNEKIDYSPNEEKLRKHREWIFKLENALDIYDDRGIKDFILMGKPSIALSDETKFTQFENESIIKIDTLLSETQKRNVFSSCSCTYPKEKLQKIKQTFSETKDIKLAHKMLQEQFEKDIEDFPFKEDMIANNWGLAGILEKDKITITKIPKYPETYFSTNDMDEKRFSYCHCGRVRKQIQEHKQTYSDAYCYCGAGYYKAIWQEILGQEIKVDVLDTVLKGSIICKFVLHLPENNLES